MIEDVLTKNLDIVFCGINPGMLAAATGHHFAGRGNRFWKVLHLAGFTEKELKPSEDRTVLDRGYGITSVVKKPTSRASELSSHDLNVSFRDFEDKILHFTPVYAAFLGKIAFSAMFNLRTVSWGEQTQTIGMTKLWVLPNPSSLSGFERIRHLSPQVNRQARSSFELRKASARPCLLTCLRLWSDPGNPPAYQGPSRAFAFPGRAPNEIIISIPTKACRHEPFPPH